MMIGVTISAMTADLKCNMTIKWRLHYEIRTIQRSVDC